MGAKAFFFSGDKYIRYDAATDRIDDGYPLAVGGFWTGLSAAGFDTNIDAALDWGNGKLFLFKGPNYLRYSIVEDKADDGYPLAIADQWPGMAAAGFGNGIDAVVNWGDGKIFFFKGDKYLRYDMAGDKVDDGYPLVIGDFWTGMRAAGFDAGLDAAINWGNGKVYFFKGDKYLRYDMANDAVDDGYPLPIAGLWPGFAEAGFSAGVKAATQLSGTGRPAPLTSDLSDSFFSNLKAACMRLGCHPVKLLLVMNAESGVRASAIHPSGGAAGINQLTTGVLPTVGWNQGTQAFTRLTADQQLPFVEKYFAPRKALGLDSIGRLYQLNYVPATARPDQGPETVLTERNGVLSELYASNTILDVNNDGKITIGDLEAHALKGRQNARWTEIESRIQ